MRTIDIKTSDDENTVTVNGKEYRFEENAYMSLCEGCAFLDDHKCGFSCEHTDAVKCIPSERKDGRHGIFVKVVE